MYNGEVYVCLYIYHEKVTNFFNKIILRGVYCGKIDLAQVEKLFWQVRKSFWQGRWENYFSRWENYFGRLEIYFGRSGHHPAIPSSPSEFLNNGMRGLYSPGPVTTRRSS